MQQSHPNTHGHRSRPYLRASMKPSFLGMQLMLHRSLHTSASHQDCTDRAREEWWKEKASFFSVLRLCGSRQVVAPCRADERITQMHSLYPSLGVQKWSKITTKWCQFQNEKPTKTQQKTNTHNPHPKQHQTKTKRKREHGMTAPKSNGIKCF